MFVYVYVRAETADTSLAKLTHVERFLWISGACVDDKFFILFFVFLPLHLDFTFKIHLEWHQILPFRVCIRVWMSECDWFVYILSLLDDTYIQINSSI